MKIMVQLRRQQVGYALIEVTGASAEDATEYGGREILAEQGIDALGDIEWVTTDHSAWRGMEVEDGEPVATVDLSQFWARRKRHWVERQTKILGSPRNPYSHDV